MVTSILRARRSRRIASMRKPNPMMWFENAQLAIGWGIVLVIVGIASGIYLVQVSKTAIVGNSARGLNFELTELRAENSQLRQDIGDAQALDNIKARANALGLQYAPADPGAVEYIDVLVPAPQPAPIAPVEEILPPPETIIDVFGIAVDNTLQSVKGVFSGE